MTQNDETKKETRQLSGEGDVSPSPPKRGRETSSVFRKALLITAIPIVVLSAISVGGIFLHWTWGGWVGVSGLAAVGWWGLAVLASIGFAIAKKRQIAAGILAGAGIGIIGLGATCFAVTFNL